MRKANILFLVALVFLIIHCGNGSPDRDEKTLAVVMDKQGPYVILSSQNASRDYGQAIELAKQLHPDAIFSRLDFTDAAAVQKLLNEVQPYYALVFIRPEELDALLIWQWLQWSAAIDQDPFIDVRTGFVTGENSAAVFNLMKRIQNALAGKIFLPATFVDMLGPNNQMAKQDFSKTPSSYLIPVIAQQFATHTIAHGVEGFNKERLHHLSGAGLIHFGGHGYPDRIVNCLNGPFVRHVPLSPCVVFSGACYTGVTGRWLDMSAGIFQPRTVAVELSFGLGVLANQAIAYLAALHADHGIPVYQEMEFLSYTGASLGNVIKHTLDGVILASGAKALAPGRVEAGNPVFRTPAEFMLWGTASRVLFGDPALKIMSKFCEAPFIIRTQVRPGSVTIAAALKNTSLKTTFTDTYFSDLSRSDQFNDRILISCPWPAPWVEVEKIHVDKLTVPGDPLPYRLIGHAFEKDRGKIIFHVQVDVESTGYMQSPFRTSGAEIEITVYQSTK